MINNKRQQIAFVDFRKTIGADQVFLGGRFSKKSKIWFLFFK